MKYTAINIGPIIKTLGLARDPRGLWAASYLFSFLMKCIFEAAEGQKADIISPAKPQDDNDKPLNTGKVGIYPDRIFIKGDVDSGKIVEEALMEFFSKFYNETPENKKLDLSYFNVMSVSCDAEKESEAVAVLNKKLDIMELCTFATDGDATQTIYDIISKKRNSPLFEMAGEGKSYNIPDTETIANRQRLDKNGNVKKILDEKGKETDEIKEKSHHRYYCIVQADGDNMGKTVSHKELEDGQIKEISKGLVNFGLNAAKIIDDFGGVPIYAGGDDLLFIAPVIGKDGSHIFELLTRIENDAFGEVSKVVEGYGLKDQDGNKIKASLSFGISITHRDYPLYEALESAQDLLFGKAKKIADKKAIAWCLRKRSGGTFNAAFSLKNEKLEEQFLKLIKHSDKDIAVSAVAHKIRQEKALVDAVMASKDTDRLNALFDKVLEFDIDKEDYFKAIIEIMPILYETIGEESYAEMLYSLLRTAKFINGEDVHDE